MLLAWQNAWKLQILFHTNIICKHFYLNILLAFLAKYFSVAGGKLVTSPKGKVQPKLKSFHEEQSPKLRMINGQSTESLESLSDEIASNSGGNNSSNGVSNNNRRGRVGVIT